MRIVIETIPHKEQRYDTCGDWRFIETGSGLPTELQVKVSQLPSSRHELCVAIHEVIEALLCLYHGIDEKEVDRFDMEWKETQWCHEPGDDPKAPYYEEHQVASGIERIFAKEIGVEWSYYEEVIAKLGETK